MIPVSHGLREGLFKDSEGNPNPQHWSTLGSTGMGRRAMGSSRMVWG